MKVKQSRDFQFYRHKVFNGEMTKEEYRDLQAGKEVDIKESLYKKYKNCFIASKKGVK
ncbi:MAG: hypothetical protein ACW99F_15665 [Candidatus Hodarchaeales archaeon]|jgi:hypothetical protein